MSSVSQSSSVPAKRRKIGSGEIPIDDIPFIYSSFNNILTQLNKITTVQSGKFKDLEEVDIIREGVKQVIRGVEDLKNLSQKAENQDLDVKSISFSKFDLDLLVTRLGIRIADINSGSTVEVFEQRLVKALQDLNSNQVNKIVEFIKKHDFSTLIRTLEIIGTHVQDKSEARGRMLIDQWLLETMFSASHLLPPNRSILLPEFHVSNLTTLPAKVQHGKYVTYITGTTDYALWSFPTVLHDMDQEGLLHSLNSNNMSAMIGFISPDDTFAFYEAKRAEEESLDKHVAQAVAQCVAAMLQPAMENYPRQMAFCLTTGQNWLFGIVDATMKPITCWKTSVFDISGMLPMTTVKALLTVLLLWKQQHATVLNEAFQKL